MNRTLLKALILFVPVSALFCRSVILLSRSRSLGSSLQLLGSAGFVIVVFTHICEALHLFPRMGWGLENSPGHYLDLLSVLLGATLFSLGYLLNAISKRNASRVTQSGSNAPSSST